MMTRRRKAFCGDFRASAGMRWIRGTLVWVVVLGLALLPVPRSAFLTSAWAGTTGGSVEVAPNLMIILSTSASMAQEMQGSVYPPAANGLPIESQCPATYSSSSDYVASDTFADDDGCGGSGTPYFNNMYGNQPLSKIYIAKTVLYNLLNSSAANNINFGFATYRQAFGLQASTSTYEASAVYPYVFLPSADQADPTPGSYANDTATQLQTVGENPLNFSDVEWWPIYDGNIGGTPLFGNGIDQYNAGILAAGIPYLSNNAGNGGLPEYVQYPPGTATPSQVGSIYYGVGGDDTTAGVPASTPEPQMNLCETFYNAEANEFQSLYNADNANGTPDNFIQTFPNQYTPNTTNYITFSAQQYNAQGQTNPVSYSQTCYNGTSEQVGYDNQLISDVLNTANGQEPATFTYVPQFWSGTSWNGSPLDLTPGTLDGWSGATTTTYDSSTGASTYTATYPSLPENEASITGSYDVSGVKWMGPFVNLPDPASGYTAQAQTIASLLNPAYPMEQSSGLDYHYSTQTMANGTQNTSVAVSDLPGADDRYQEPVYDSLEDALAYFTAYEKADPYHGCRTNEILLVYDGHEDGHPIPVYNSSGQFTGNYTYPNPADVAKQLAKIGVKTNVVIISSNTGDIAQANQIAVAGGTHAAYQVSDYQNLYHAISAVFTALQGTVVQAPPVTPGDVANGSYVYTTATDPDYGSVAGHLYAYATNAQGVPGTSPAWDAAALMNTGNRQSDLYTDAYVAGGGAVPPVLLTSAAASAFASTNPTPATIQDYTITPDYGGGAYLAGRSATSFVGAINDQAMQPVLITPPNNLQLNGAVSSGNGQSYASFAQSESSLPGAVLFSSNDGFLYDVNAQTGALNWGWMPSPFLPQLQNYSTFWQSSPMDGGFRFVQAANSAGWGNYVVGTALDGAMQYALSVNANGSLGDIDWINQESNATTPNAQAPVVFWNDSDGIADAVYVTETVSGGTTTATLNETQVDTGVTTTATLPFVPTSSLTAGQNAIYVGDANGNIWSLPDLTSASSMVGSSTKVGGTQPVTVNDVTSTQPIQYVGYTQFGGKPYLWGTSPQQLTVFDFTPNGWAPDWNSSNTGAGTWVNGVYTPDTQGASVSGTSIQWLPSNGQIDAKTVLAGNTLLVPVYVPASGTAATCGVGAGYYLLYRLDTGAFPNGVFTKSNGTAVTGNLYIGLGRPYAAQVSPLQSGGLMVYGSSQQNASGGIGVQASALAAQNMGSGVSAWRNYLTQ